MCIPESTGPNLNLMIRLTHCWRHAVCSIASVDSSSDLLRAANYFQPCHHLYPQVLIGSILNFNTAVHLK